MRSLQDNNYLQVLEQQEAQNEQGWGRDDWGVEVWGAEGIWVNSFINRRCNVTGAALTGV